MLGLEVVVVKSCGRRAPAETAKEVTTLVATLQVQPKAMMARGFNINSDYTFWPVEKGTDNLGHV